MNVRALAISLAFLGAACQTPAGNVFKAIVLQPDGSYAMPVALRDRTGLITAIEPVNGEWSSGDLPTVKLDGVYPMSVVVSWGTGACVDDTGLSFDRTADGYNVNIQVHSGLVFACSAQLLVRGLRVRLSESVPIGSITVQGGE
jgi:hypothetical protein